RVTIGLDRPAARPGFRKYLIIIESKNREAGDPRAKINRSAIAQTGAHMLAFARDRFRLPRDRAHLMPSQPLALSDQQLDQLFRLTRPLAPACRNELLRLL